MIPQTKKEVMKMAYLAIGIPIRYFDANKKIVFAYPQLDKTVDPVQTEHTFVDDFFKEVYSCSEEQFSVHTKITTFGLFFAAMPCSEYKGGIIILGPTPAKALIKVDFPRMAEEHKIANYENLSVLIRSLTKMLFCDFVSATGLIYYLEWNRITNLTKARQSPNTKPLNLMEQDSSFLVERLFKNREDVPMRPVSGAERQLLQYVKNGDAKAALNFLEYALVEFEDRSSGNIIEKAKNSFIALTSIIANGAVEAGLDSERAWFMWDSYVQKAKLLKDISELNKLYILMISDYSEGVTSLKKQYSRAVTLCSKYISEHIHEDISLSVLSKITGLSIHHLSDTFKKETGMSLPYYVQFEKIKEAKQLLTFSNYSLTEISNYLNFSSQSYFTTVFKRHCGLTPQTFRDKYYNKYEIRK